MGETRVDLLHLLEDLADAYSGALEETVLTEIVANALDSGATLVRFMIDTTAATLTTIDDGTGMRRAELRRFHDVAASAKTKGEGIGFAGVGIKLGLLVSGEVVTETRRGKEHVCTSWSLANRKRAPWHWVEPPGWVGEHGTAVRLTMRNPLSPLLDAAYLEQVLHRHFEPFFDPAFDEVLAEHYKERLRFAIGDRELPRDAGTAGDTAPIAIRITRRRKPAAWGWIARYDTPLPDDRQGIAVSTLGKVIKRGWDWLGLTPANGERVSGIVEAPALAAALTLNKADFVRAGPRGAIYLTYRKALQQSVSDQLASWGDVNEPQQTDRRRAARPVERDVETVLLDLAEQFPMLAMLVERRAGGERKLRVGVADGRGGGEVPDLFTSEATFDTQAGNGNDVAQPPDEESQPVEPSPPTAEANKPLIESPGSSRTKRRPTRLGLTIRFESRPDESNLGRFVETTVWVNDAHPAYRRAVDSRSEGYHLALTVAMALAAVATEPAQTHAFVTEFLSRWGESASGNGSGRKRRSRKRSAH